MNTKIGKILCVMFLASFILMAAFSPQVAYKAAGADGSNGTLQIGFSEYNPGDSYVFICKDLDVSSDYTLDFTAGCASQYNFTTGASEETVYHRVTLEAPTSGSECIVTLEAQSTGTAIDTVRLQATEIEDIINDTDITDLIMTVLVIIVLVGVAVGIYRKFG